MLTDIVITLLIIHAIWTEWRLAAAATALRSASQMIDEWGKLIEELANILNSGRTQYKGVDNLN